MNWLKKLFRRRNDREFAQLANFQERLKSFIYKCHDFDKAIEQAASAQEIKCGTFVREKAIITISLPGRDTVSMTADQWIYAHWERERLKRETKEQRKTINKLRKKLEKGIDPAQVLKQRLYAGLEHGSPEHRSWLKAVIDACVDDSAYVPAPPEELAVR